jgi:putative transposase
MRSEGLVGVRRGKPWRTTVSDPSAPRSPDLVNRDFTATGPNQLWVADFTYCATWSGMVFTAFVVDVFSRRIVGWRTASTMTTDLPLDALEMALWAPGPAHRRPGPPLGQGNSVHLDPLHRTHHRSRR